MANTCMAVLLTLGWATAGCGNSDSSSDSSSTTVAPETSSAATETASRSSIDSASSTAADSGGALAAAQKAAGETLASAKDSVTQWTSQLTESVQGGGDGKVTELAQDLTAKIKEFTSTLSGEEDATLTEKLKSAVGSLSKGDDKESLGMLQQIKEAKLTEEQSELAAEVQNVWSALVVQRNFSSLSADGEVSNIVTALKGGDTAAAMTHLKTLSGKATLSENQKELVNSLVTQYAPGLKDAGQAVSDSVKKLNPFGQD